MWNNRFYSIEFKNFRHIALVLDTLIFVSLSTVGKSVDNLYEDFLFPLKVTVIS